MDKYIKIGLACIRDNKLLLCRPYAFDDLILPGGQLENGETDIQCLAREIDEELGTDAKIDESSLEYIGRFEDVAAGHKDKRVEITLYVGKLSGELCASDEIKQLVWFSPSDDQDALSRIVRRHIIPALIKASLLTED